MGPFVSRPWRLCLKHGGHKARRAHTLERQTSSNIPFEQVSLVQPRSAEEQPSTLTKPERAIFERIARKREQDDHIIGSSPLSTLNLNDGYEDLSTLFEAADCDQEARERLREEAMERQRIAHNPSYQRAVEELREPVKLTRMSRVSDGIDKGFRRPLEVESGRIVEKSTREAAKDDRLQICREHRQEVKGKLEAAATDVEIWRALEEAAFSLMSRLNEQMKQENTESAESKDGRGSEAKVRVDAKRLPLAVKVDGTSSARPGSQQILPGTLGESRALTSNAILSLLQENYAYLSLLALRLFRRRHPRTPYSLQILPTIKSLGKISYVLGASTGLYNEVLYVKWTQYHDLHGIADLVYEMINQGLGTNQLTYELLRVVERTRTKDMMGQRGQVMRSWWELRGVHAAWMRVMEVTQRLQKDMEHADQEQGYQDESSVSNSEVGMHDALNAQGDGLMRRSQKEDWI